MITTKEQIYREVEKAWMKALIDFKWQLNNSLPSLRDHVSNDLKMWTMELIQEESQCLTNLTLKDIKKRTIINIDNESDSENVNKKEKHMITVIW